MRGLQQTYATPPNGPRKSGDGGNASVRKTKTNDELESLSSSREEDTNIAPRSTQISNTSPKKNKRPPLAPQYYPSTSTSHSNSTGSSSTNTGSVRVVVRSRPMNSFEKTRGDAHVFRFDNSQQNNNSKEMQVVTNMQNGRESIRPFQFDLCASERLDQVHFFQTCGVKNLIDSVLQGYFATVFAYGQTGSGKTYSMSGLEELLGGLNGKKPHSHNSHSRNNTGNSTSSSSGGGMSSPRRSAEPTSTSTSNNGGSPDLHDGIIPRSIKYLYSRLAQLNEVEIDTQYSIRASYCEIYNEHVYDLLNPPSGSLHVRFNDRDGFYVQDQLVVQCDAIDDVMAVVSEGHKNRRVGIHEMNKDSSRSHSIMTIYVDITPKSEASKGLTAKRMGKISFVDLAGSERLKETKSSNAEETSNINKSLLTLGKVISALASKTTANPNFIPYRDSKLTKLLMDSLGGNSLTLMIACVAPSSCAIEETLSTLTYATRAKNIQNKPTIQVDAIEASMASLRRENLHLKEENENLKRQLGRSRGQQEDDESLMVEQATISKERTVIPPLVGGHGPPTKKSQGHADTSEANWRNQVQNLQDENSRLTEQVHEIERHLSQLQMENRNLQRQGQHQSEDSAQVHRHRPLQEDDIKGEDDPPQESSLNRAQKEIHYLKKQIGQLQDREQELMQALSRRSRGSREQNYD